LNIGFNTTGLWRYSRHPNFLAEQTIWVSLYAWSCAITKTPYNWSGVGAAGYLLLFQASTVFTESISSDKYAEYKNYQKNVGMFLPLPGKGWSPVERTQRAIKNAKKRQ
jgi:steroid 5-alpha reductase family enzyme